MLSMPTLLAHFTHTSESLKSGRWYTCLTCSLCHADAAQRDHALLSLLLAGWGPAASLGVAATAAIFFGGTAAAALNSAGRDLQTRRWLDNSTGGWAGWVTPRAARMYNAAGFWRVCGGSPGIFALLGADLCLTLEQARSLLQRWEEEPAARPHLMGSLAWLVGAISNTISMVLAEQRALTHGQSLSGAQARKLSGTQHFAPGQLGHGADFNLAQCQHTPSSLCAGGSPLGLRVGRRLLHVLPVPCSAVELVEAAAAATRALSALARWATARRAYPWRRWRTHIRRRWWARPW